MKIHIRVLLGFAIGAVLLTGCDQKKASPGAEKKSDVPISSEALPDLLVLDDKKLDRDREGAEVRGPKQKHSEIISSPNQSNPIGDRLRSHLEGLRPDESEYDYVINQLWNKSLSQMSNEVLESSHEEDVYKGVMLPKELKGMEPSNRWVDTPEAMLGGVAFMAVAANDGLLLSLAQQASDTLPPTKADLAIFEALNDAIKELGSTRTIASFENWKPLARARNPLYRLLALRAAIRSTSQAASDLSSEDPSYNRVDGSAKLDFYLGFLDEKDPLILGEAISAVATVPTPEARQAIEKFKATQQQRGNASLVEAATVALRTQELISKSSR